MDSHGVEVFHVADGYAVVGGVAHDLVLDLFPADEGAFEEDLPDGTGADAGLHDEIEFGPCMRDSATGSTEGVGGPDDERDFREPDLVGECVGLFHGVDDGGGGYRFAEGVHELAELVAVLGLADGPEGGAKQADVVFLKNAGVGEFAREVEAGLSAEGGQEAFGALAGDDALEDGYGEGLDVDGVGDFGVGHDGGGIGVDEDAAHAFLAHGLAGLRSGVVELGGLADDDGAGPDDEDGCGLVADTRWGCGQGCPRTGRCPDCA